MSIVFSGPSGSGKTTIITKISKIFNIPISVSCTTRKPRKGEVNHRDYEFVSKEVFIDKIKNDELEEYAIFNGDYYGTQKITSACKLYDVEPKGFRYFLETHKDWIFVYIDASKDILKCRLQIRGASDEDIERRLSTYDTFNDLKSIKSIDLIVNNNGQLLESVNKIVNFLVHKKQMTLDVE